MNKYLGIMGVESFIDGEGSYKYRKGKAIFKNPVVLSCNWRYQKYLDCQREINVDIGECISM